MRAEVVLGDLVEFRKGKKPMEIIDVPDVYAQPFYQIDELRGVKLPRFAVDKNGTEVSKDDICIVWDGANAGTVGYGLEGLIGSTITRMRIKQLDKVYAPYLGRLLQSKFTLINGAAQGAAIPHVNSNQLRNLIIALPTIKEQKRITIMFDKADAIRRKRKQIIEMTDSLVKSIFIEMFGEPLVNPLGWPEERKLGDVSEIISGITKGRKLNGQRTREVPYMAVINVQDRHLRLDTVKTIEATEGEIKKYKLKKNDLLLTEGGDPDKLGRGTLWRCEIPECIHQNHVFRVRLQDNTLNPVFLKWLIGSSRGKAYFLKSAKQTTGIASINKTQLEGFPLFIPPIALQQKFEELRNKAKSIENKIKEELIHDRQLLTSLSRDAFSGKF